MFPFCCLCGPAFAGWSYTVSAWAEICSPAPGLPNFHKHWGQSHLEHSFWHCWLAGSRIKKKHRGQQCSFCFAFNIWTITIHWAMWVKAEICFMKHATPPRSDSSFCGFILWMLNSIWNSPKGEKKPCCSLNTHLGLVPFLPLRMVQDWGVPWPSSA